MSGIDWKNLNLWQTFPNSSAEEKPKSFQLKYAHGFFCKYQVHALEIVFPEKVHIKIARSYLE